MHVSRKLHEYALTLKGHFLNHRDKNVASLEPIRAPSLGMTGHSHILDDYDFTKDTYLLLLRV
jgi:hypothetical protein